MDNPKAFIDRVEAAWRTRARTLDGKKLTRNYVHVAAKLAWWRSANPKQAQLARAAGVSVRTVQRALAVLHGLGLLSWTRCVVACRGWRAQVANIYRPLSCQPLSYFSIRIQSSANLSPPGMQAVPATGQSDLLAARRAVIQAEWLGRHRRSAMT